jgi:Glycosyl transferase family 2
MSISVVVPAHNEERVVAANLRRLLADAEPGEFDVVVVCNGCADGTAGAARSVPGVRVVELAEAGKAAALRHGDTLATGYPRLYLDADVCLDTASARALARAVTAPGMHAAGPRRRLELGASGWLVRAYYSVWERLPEVREGLFGRGVVAVSEEGHRRVRALPAARSDDLALHIAFAPEERRVVPEATSVIKPPRTARDLLRRRVRALQGTNELSGPDMPPNPRWRTSWADLGAIVRRRPAALPHVSVFLGYALVSRLAVRWGRFDRTAWLRDESSRHP